MKEDTEISKLIRLKRYEQPDDSYFENFLMEFQRRQRSELLRRSTTSIFLERLATYFSDFASPRALATTGAFCLALFGLVLSQYFHSGSGSTNTTAEFAEVSSAEASFPPPPLAQPLPLPEEVFDGPLEIYPVGIQKVGASYYLLQEPALHSRTAPGADRSTYRLPVIDLTEDSE